MLKNYLAGRWQPGTGAGTPLLDPVLGVEVARVSSAGLDKVAGFAHAREQGGQALRAMSYGERAAMLGKVLEVLQANRDAYYEIATANSGTTRPHSAVDIDGALFTLGQYVKWGAGLGDARQLFDGDAVSLARDGSFQVRHALSPRRGVALFINAFNFPAWGLWEKAAPALLSGVPVIVKPATATAWLTQRMVADVVDAGVVPTGALSVVCGSADGLLDALESFDMLSFTGSAQTAAQIRRHPAVADLSVRVNIEADSVNAAVLAPDQHPDSVAFGLMVDEVVREMVVKSGQKCTAIRRVFVPQACYEPMVAALRNRLQDIKVGNPRNDTVSMGALASRDQWRSVCEGIGQLAQHAQLLLDGREVSLVDADPAVAACVGPTLFGCEDPDSVPAVHAVEVFGPVATVMPYRDAAHAAELVRRGQGSLVVSLFGEQAGVLAGLAAEVADSHGRVHIVSPEVAKAQTGHGNVMPISLHGGPGRAGGGEELGGLRALLFYHQRSAIQASAAVLDALAENAAVPGF